MDEVDPVLLAVSDLLVLVALERAFSRGVPRHQRVNVPAYQRHRAFEMIAVPPERITHGLKDAWILCPILASRHRFDLDVPSWQQMLDTYTRALLMMCQPHTRDRLNTHMATMLVAAS